MRANIISAGSLAFAMTLQASAAPTQNWKRALELDLSEIDNRAFNLLDERGLGQRFMNKVNAFVKSPTVRAMGSAVGSTLLTAGVNRIFKRIPEMDPSEIENRDFDLDELEVREPQRGRPAARRPAAQRPAARSGMNLPSTNAMVNTLQRVGSSPTAGRVVRAAAQGARRLITSPTAKNFAGDFTELSARDLELLEKLLQQREFDGSIGPMKRELNPADELELNERDLNVLLKLVTRGLELEELD